MNRLVVRNIGPIKEVDICLNKVNVFIGPQSSGKSTLAKIISFCTWLEKRNEATDKAVVDGLVNRLQSFHKMNGYFRDDSAIFYHGTNVVFAYNWDEPLELSESFQNYNSEHFRDKEILLTSVEKTVNPKVIYIPAERNFVSAVPNLKKYAEKDDSLQSFINDWFEGKRHYTEDSSLPIIDLGVDYYYNAGTDRDMLKLDKANPVRLSAASSGLQSIVPLVAMIKWMSSGIYEENKPFSPEEDQRVREMLSNLPEQITEAQMELVNRIQGFIKGKVYTHTQFIIEEPEQNIFPETQKTFLYYLLAEINHGRNHHLVLTTHSQYVLYALNNCMLAYLVKDKVTPDIESEVNIECLKYAIDPKTVSVYEIRDGRICGLEQEANATIQDEDGLVRGNYFDRVMHNVMADFTNCLSFMD